MAAVSISITLTLEPMMGKNSLLPVHLASVASGLPQFAFDGLTIHAVINELEREVCIAGWAVRLRFQNKTRAIEIITRRANHYTTETLK